jgi:hypothetical protein
MSSSFMKAALVCAATVVVGLGGTAAHAATGTADVSATILDAVTVTNTADLLFGNIAAGAAPATVSISAGGTVNCGGLVCNGTQNPAGFSVTGTAGQTVGISLPLTSITLTSGTDSMTVSGLASDVASIVLDGTDAFTVGGSLAVAANQAAGTYTGSFSVDVDYQ